MNKVLSLIVLLTFVFTTTYFSQENAKGLKLKIIKVVPIVTKGKTSWEVKTVVKNKTNDTLYYFNIKNCEAVNYMAMASTDTIQLFADFIPCENTELIVVAIPPKAQREVDVLISSVKPIYTPVKFKILLAINKANNRTESLQKDELENFKLMKLRKRHVLLVSNNIKV